MFFLAFGVIATLAKKADIANKDTGRDNESEDFVLEDCKAEAVFVKRCVGAGDKTEKYQDAWYDKIKADGGWLNDLMKIERSNCTALTQDQFTPKKEPLTITNPGCYYLKEDIEVDFGAVYDMTGDGKIESPLHHGFPYAIRILGKDVRIDLNKKTIKMSASYFRLQPFMSIFDLGQFPFPGARGGYPAIKKSANNVFIHDGTIGRTSHFGIHGNQNDGLVIRDVKLQHFGVAGIMFNTVKHVSVEHVVVDNAGHKANTKVSYGLILEMYRKVQLFKSKGSACADGNTAIKNYAKAEMDKMLKDEDFLKALKNPGEGHTARSDGADAQGNIYGIYFSAQMNVLKIASTQRPYDNLGDSSDIRIMDVQVKNIAKGSAEGKSVWFGDAQNNINEVIQPPDWNGHLHDYDAVCDDDDKFKEQSLASKISVWRMVFTECFVPNKSWKDQGMDGQYEDFRDQVLANLANRKNGFKAGTKCRKVENAAGGIRPLSGFDIAGHKSKPLIGIRIDQVSNILISHVTVEGLHNKGPRGKRTIIGENAYLATPPVWQSSAHTTFLYRGNWAYGITLSGCNKANVEHTVVRNLKSDKGSVVGVAAIGENRYLDIHNVIAEELIIKEDQSARVPNMVPIAIPFYQEFSTSTLAISNISPNYVYKFTGKDCEQINEQVTAECQEIRSTGVQDCGALPKLEIPACKADSTCSGKPAVIEEKTDVTIGGASHKGGSTSDGDRDSLCVDMQLSFIADDPDSLKDKDFHEVLKDSVASAADVSPSTISFTFFSPEESNFSVQVTFRPQSDEVRSGLVDTFADKSEARDFLTKVENSTNANQDDVLINGGDAKLCSGGHTALLKAQAKSSDSTSVIIFFVVGLLVLVLIALAAFCYQRRQKTVTAQRNLQQQQVQQTFDQGRTGGKNLTSSRGKSSREKGKRGTSNRSHRRMDDFNELSSSKRSGSSSHGKRSPSNRRNRHNRGLE